VNASATTDGMFVSLTFDDALEAHLDAAMPILEQHGLRGTFYVNIGATAFTTRQRDWVAAAERGHELGNHTIFHPGVSSKSWVTEGIALDHYSVDRMRHELTVANQWLQTLDGRTQRSFAFPCSNPWLGRAGWPRRLLARMKLDRTRIAGWVDRLGLDFGSRLIDYTPLARELFVAARCGGIAPEALPELPPDRHRVRAVDGDGADLAMLRHALSEAKCRTRWATFVFHGISGGHHLSVDRQVFSSFCEQLANDENVVVLPFADAAARLQTGAQPND
jgi:peptidoglycan-N-acetylglucosamine deacetylase